MPAHALTLEVRRDDISALRVVETALPDSLQEGQVLLAVDRFALTANNITYTQVGDALGYWRFFPTDDAAWGRVPAMGYASVARSEHPDIRVGERVWGFFPMGTHLLIEAGKVNGFTFMDVAAHREGLAPIYAQFQRAASNPLYQPEREEQDSLLRGLFLTSWLCEDALFDEGFYDAQDCLITSASSKTAIALAFAVHRRGAMRSVGLTSERNRDFCVSLGCYDAVHSYQELSTLDATRKAVLVDMAGSAAVNGAIHEHYGHHLTYDCRIGVTHGDGLLAGSSKLSGPKPQAFFAPHQAAKRGAEWGAETLEKRIGVAFAAFREFADGWLEIKRFDGPGAAEAAFRAMTGGTAAPHEGYSLSLSNTH